MPMIFVLQHLSSCQNYLNTYQLKVESKKKLSLHRDKKAKFTTYVYCKPTSIGIFTHFETFLPSTIKTGVIYKLL